MAKSAAAIIASMDLAVTKLNSLSSELSAMIVLDNNKNCTSDMSEKLKQVRSQIKTAASTIEANMEIIKNCCNELDLSTSGGTGLTGGSFGGGGGGGGHYSVSCMR
jgi:formiminotetrahydrofolate cyclodeaminase